MELTPFFLAVIPLCLFGIILTILGSVRFGRMDKKGWNSKRLLTTSLEKLV